MLVAKASGKVEPFSKEKLERSLRASGAPKDVIQRILSELRPKLYSGISTKKLYRSAFQLLRQDSHHFAASYSLKKALYQLGPGGYPFEKFVGAIYAAEGYKTKFNIAAQGTFVSHEIDVVASKNEVQTYIECKFHKKEGLKCDVKITMYIFGRWTDLRTSPAHKNLRGFHLVTNTKFTSEAIKFGTGVGLGLMSWNYPPNKSLKDRIEQHHLHPVTCLTNLTLKQKRELMERNIVLCQDLLKNNSVLRTLRLKRGVMGRVLRELRDLLGSSTDVGDA